MKTETKKKIESFSLGAGKYVLLSIIMVISIWALQRHFDKQLRGDINQVAVASCVAGRGTLIKYNNTINIQIINTVDLLKINRVRRDKLRIAANLAAIARLESNKIKVPTVHECQVPILK